MGNTPSVRHLRTFRTNPVEVAIFLAVTGLFVNSVVKLFYDSPDFQATALTQMASNPVSEGRAPASTQQSFLNLDVRCETAAEQETAASKVRLMGSLCGLDASTDGSKLTKTVVINNANKFSATIFTDVSAGKFSTDYIPLNVGRNPLHLEFTYRGGKTVTQELVINKN